MTNIAKDPVDVLDYKFDFAALTNGVTGATADWLESGETISSYVITSATGITVDSDSLTDSNTSVTVWLSGGTEGNTYTINCKITTSAGREADEVIFINVIEDYGTLVVEDGTGLSNSNTYVNESYLFSYAAARGVTISSSAPALLIQGMDYIEQQLFKGEKGSEAQALQWPRDGVWLDGYYVDGDEIPTLLKEALCEVALGVDGGDSPLSNVSRETKTEKVDVISVTYMDGAREKTYLTAVENKLKKLLAKTGQGINGVAIRA